MVDSTSMIVQIVSWTEGGGVRALEIKKISEAKLKLKKRKPTVGFHHGRLQVVPVYWKFPNMTIKQLIDN